MYVCTQQLPLGHVLDAGMCYKCDTLFLSLLYTLDTKYMAMLVLVPESSYDKSDASLHNLISTYRMTPKNVAISFCGDELSPEEKEDEQNAVFAY